MGGLAQFMQPIAQVGTTTTGQRPTQGPQTQYFGILQQPMGVLPEAAPTQQPVGVPARAISEPAQMITTPNQGYLNPSMQVPYYGSPQVPLVIRPPIVPDSAVVGSGTPEGYPGPTNVVVTTASHPQ